MTFLFIFGVWLVLAVFATFVWHVLNVIADRLER